MTHLNRKKFIGFVKDLAAGIALAVLWAYILIKFLSAYLGPVNF